MSEKELNPALANVSIFRNGTSRYITIRYPAEDIPNTIVIFNNRQNTNYVYDVCRDDRLNEAGIILMDYPLESCPGRHRNATITLRMIGRGPKDRPDTIERLTQFT